MKKKLGSIAIIIFGISVFFLLFFTIQKYGFLGNGQTYFSENSKEKKVSDKFYVQIVLHDNEENPVPGIKVSLVGTDGIAQEKETTAYGSASFTNVMKGTYIVKTVNSTEKIQKYIPFEEDLSVSSDSFLSYGLEKIPQLEICMVGDNLIHYQISQKAYNKETDHYSYEFLYAGIQEDIDEADIAIINQETIFVADRANISPYPRFGTPVDMGESLVNVGFDVVLCATNHTADKGVTGVQDTLAFWDTHPEMTICGIYKSQEDKERIRVVEANGIRVAILNYTYGLNGLSFPEGKEYMTNVLDDKARIGAEIKEAKTLADIVLVSPHIGVEYSFVPSDFQKDWIQFFSDMGADIVICTHPHVLEPYGMVGNTLVYYSLGNFVSNQTEIPRLLGGMAKIILQKIDGKVCIASYDCVPLVTHYTSTNHMVYKLSDYTEEFAKQHTITSERPEFSKAYLEKLYDQIMQGEK